MNKPNRSKYYDSNHNSSLLNLPVMRAAYSDRTAWLMARCSELAYVEFEAGQEQQLRDSLKELGLEFVRGFSRDATCACLARNDRFAVLAFRGTTQDYRNILTDMDIRFYRDKSGARRSEEHTSELQSRFDLVCRLLLEKKK